MQASEENKKAPSARTITKPIPSSSFSLALALTMESSGREHQFHSNSFSSSITAPPPTPSIQHQQPNSLSTSDAADALSHLLHRLPPSLSLPSRLSPRTISPPVIPFSPHNPHFLLPHLSSFSHLGFFQLTNHSITSHLAHSAESESISLFNLSETEKQESFSKTWPLGYEEEGACESFCFDGSCLSEFTESTQTPLPSLQEFTRELGKIGVEIVKALSCAMGFEKGLEEKETQFSSLMWISESVAGNKESGRFYPSIVSLQYQIRCQKFSLLTDSGWVTASPHVDSVLVTVGDIAQVWSNGRLKKVRGKPVAVVGDTDESPSINMCLLVTLPIDPVVTISPFLLVTSCHDDEGGDDKNDKDRELSVGKKEKLVFESFSFEDYAWRVYHERFLFKDPLDRYRIQS